MQAVFRFLMPAVLVCVLTANGIAQANFFKPLASTDLPEAIQAPSSVLRLKSYRLDEAAMRKYLRKAPLESQDPAVAIPLEIPLPNGKTEVFGMLESPILSPEVAAQHPDIKTYTGNGLHNKKALIRLSFTSEGFNAIILNVEGGAVYFDKYTKPAKDLYYNYFTRDVVPPEKGNQHKSCDIGLLGDTPSRMPAPDISTQQRAPAAAVVTLKTFRLAMAANGEFTAQHGGTQAGALAAVVGYVNRMTALYKNELGVSFTLVSGVNLIYTDATTDPYDNDDQVLMLNQNQSNCNTVIGSANYDIGHVWGYTGGSGGGIASLESVCYNPQKGRGVSGEGDLSDYAQVFMDQLLFHEVGHQFGMTHSYNSSIPVCTTREETTSVEPGAGATIMSYGFTCGSDDYFTTNLPATGPILQFHAVNLAQAIAYMANPISGYGNCYAPTVTSNHVPVVTVPGAYTIPKSTPFALIGSATDEDGDVLSYCWEGTDVGAFEPDENTLADLTQPPFFRSYGLVDSSGPTRYYPLLSAILNGSNYAKADKLPSVGITTHHRLTVRDNNSAGGGVSYGDVTVTVDGNIGPFLVTSNLSGSYAGNSNQTVTWSVNGTSAATPNVKILLSTDGGLSFPTTLLASTVNDGSQAVTLPNVTTTTARIKVEAVGNIFFDISNSNFSITAVAVTTCPANSTVCLNTTPFNLTGGTPAGGTYSGPGVSGGVFDPATAGVGTHTITYTNGTACTFSITVNALPSANAGPDQGICSSGTATLAAVATNGTGAWTVTSGPSTLSTQFSNTGSATAMFTPAGGAGAYTLRWTVSNAPCAAATDEVVITVNGCAAGTDLSGLIVLKRDNTSGIKDVNVILSGDQSGSMLTPLGGNYSFSSVTGSNFGIRPVKNANKLNGVNAADLTRIQQHLSGSPITDPWQLIAADVNSNNAISALDVNIMQLVLLGNATALAQFSKSWRFVPQTHTMTNPPWGFPENIALTGVSGSISNLNFWGLKVGDLVSDYANPANSSGAGWILSTRDEILTKGRTLTVDLMGGATRDLAALQLALYFNPAYLELSDMESLGGLPMNEDNFGAWQADQGSIRVVWSVAEGVSLAPQTPLLRLKFTVLEGGLALSEILHLDNETLLAQVYDSKLGGSNVSLRFETVTAVQSAGTDKKALQLLQNQPNPFVHQTTVAFVLPEACEAQIRIVDAAGRVVVERRQRYPAGLQAEVFDLNSGSGVFYCELTTPFGVLVRKMVAVD